MRRSIAPRWGLLFVVLFLAVAGVLSAFDTIRLRNGNVIEGKIIYQDGAEVHIVSRGSRMTITRDRIAEVIQVPDEEIGPGETYATEALRQMDEGRAREAWRSLLSMAREEADAVDRHVSLVRRTVSALVREAEEHLAASRTSETLDLIAQLERTESAALILAVYPDAAESMEERFRVMKGRAHAIAGREARLERDYSAAEQEFGAALRFLNREDSDYLNVQLESGQVYLARGEIAAGADRQDEALQYFGLARRAFEQVISNPPSADALTNARSALNRTRERAAAIQRAREQAAAQAAAAAATPTPTPFVAPTPTPEPEPEADFLSGVLGDDLAARIQGFLPEEVTTDDLIRWGGYFLAFAIGFWFVPWLIFKILMKRGDMLASLWKPRLWYLGPIALVGYVIAYFRLPDRKERKTKAKHPCPHCGFKLDNVMLFEKMDFHHCPNCGGEIEPVHTEDDYIKACAGQLATDVEKVTMGLVTMQSFASKDMMQRLVRGLITKAVRHRASDIHVEPQPDSVSVRYRVDGMMIPMAKLPASLGPGVVSAIKVAATLDISEKRKPQDGAFSQEVDETSIDIRVASSPAQNGETVSMRLLDFRALQTDSRKLGMSRSTREVYERVIREPHGLILVCGPTGSGKTTTLYVALRTIATGDKNIISVEDPIEFRIPGVNQIQVNPVAGLTFASALRSILRQDPDVLMIGEVRDKETAEIAINAAQTGHLVFTSLHTIDAASSVTRLYDFGISARQFSSALSLVLAQRLIRLVCPDCKRPIEPDEKILRDIGVHEEDEADYQFLAGKGCDTCNKTGFLGRSGVFELLVPNTQLRQVLESGEVTTVQLREIAIANGMRSLREEALIMLRQGLTTPEEVLRVTK